MTVASAVALANSVNQLIDASNPAVAAAIAAYHLVDGIFDTGMSYGKGLSPAAVSYSEIWPVAKIKPVKL